MTIQELYEWAEKRNLLNVPIAKHFNFNIEDIECVSYLTEEITKSKAKVVLD